MSQSNRVKNITISGASGTLGTILTTHLLSQGLHRVSALIRPGNTRPLPSGLHAVHRIDQSSHSLLVSALRGEDALILTIAPATPLDVQKPLILAAAEAGVKWIMPNEYSLDNENDSLVADVGIGAQAREIRKYIEEVGKGKTKWISLSCGFWYEFSLAGGEVRFGFDLAEKKLTMFDEGETKISVSTWARTARAVGRIFALPERREEGVVEGPVLEDWGNKGAVYVRSFVVSQREMLESVLRVTGDRREDWTVGFEGSAERFGRAKERLGEGDMGAAPMVVYTRVFFPNGGGDSSGKAVDAELGLPEEDLDEATREGLRIHGEGFWAERTAAIAARNRK